MNPQDKIKKFRIRDIEKKDSAKVYEMFLSLVKYEGLEDKFKLTKQRMEDYFFGENSDWFCLVVQDLIDNDLKGFLTYTFSNTNRAFHLSSLVQIDHLYIKSSYRNKGVGESLIYELKNRSQIKGANRLEVWCMTSNKIGNQFYKKVGAEQMNFINLYRMRIN